MEKSYDVVVIGAGPAGTCTAMHIARAGYSVCVLEKAEFPRFVIGESLLPRCNDLLAEAGLLDAVASQGYFVKHGAAFVRGGEHGEERAAFSFAEQFSESAPSTWHVPRDHFDNVLAETAMSAGVPIFFRHGVSAAEVGAAPSVTVEDPEGAQIRVDCRFIVDASGYGRVLPRLLGLSRPSDFPVRRATFAHVASDGTSGPETAGQTWIIAHDRDTWFWLIPFSDGRTSLGVVARPGFYEGLPDDPEACLRAAVAREPLVADAVGDAPFVRTPRTVSAYSVGVTRLFGEGFCLVGNATEFLDPIFSSGVSLALESADRAARTLIRQLDGKTVDWQRDYAGYVLACVDTFRTYVETWYDGTLQEIFFSPRRDEALKRQICSVLAGHVRDRENPFVRRHRTKVRQLARLIAEAG